MPSLFLPKRLLALLLLLPACTHAGPDREDPTPIPAPSRDGFGSPSAQEGLLLLTPLKSKDVFLVDRDGEIVHRWETDWEPGNSVYLTDRGTLYRCMRIEEDVDFAGGGIGGGVQEIAPDGTILWEYRMADAARHHHHDIELLPNGNLLLLAWVKHSKEDALARGRDPELLRGEEFWPDSIFEIKPIGTDDVEIVWEWHSWDHLIQDFDPDAVGFGVVADHPERIDINGDRDPEPMSEEDLEAEMEMLIALGYAGGYDDTDAPTEEQAPLADAPSAAASPEHDGDAPGDEPQTEKEKRRAKFRDADWMHTNGIDYHAGLDQIVISVRTFDEIWVIDHSTTTSEAAGSTGGRYGKGGDLLYRWGNPSAYGQGGYWERTLFAQHDVQWIEDEHLGAGGMILFNNGRGRPDEEFSSIEEWWPPRNAYGAYLREPDMAFGPAEASWTYTAPIETEFYSSFISGVQRLPNGNTLITSGAPGRVFEVQPSGEIVWEWLCDLVPDEEPKEGEKSSPVKANSLFRVTWLPHDHPGVQAIKTADSD